MSQSDEQVITPRTQSQISSGFPIALSHKIFPKDNTTYEKLGMPVGCSVTPFASNDYKQITQPTQLSHIINIARCDTCSGYINYFCTYTKAR